MSNKENRILNESGAQYPFKVPEGYFDNLTARIMDHIPEEKQETPVISIAKHPSKSNSRKWFSAISIAASLALIAVISTKFINTNAPSNAIEQTANVENAKEYSDIDSYNEDLMLYSMVDNGDIYDYLSGGEY